jgi:hypothetical protein
MTSVLASWKDIAQYVGKGVRTVQRWEHELDFPVRRTRQAGKSVVLAVPAEIDAWVQLQQIRHRHVGSERTELLQSLNALRSENQDLRHQLALAEARLMELDERLKQNSEQSAMNLERLRAT